MVKVPHHTCILWCATFQAVMTGSWCDLPKRVNTCAISEKYNYRCSRKTHFAFFSLGIWTHSNVCNDDLKNQTLSCRLQTNTLGSRFGENFLIRMKNSLKCPEACIHGVFLFFSLKSFCVKAHSERTIWEESSTVEVQRILISINLWTNFLLIKGEYRISQKKRSSMVTEFPLNHDFQILWCLKWCHMVEEKPDYLHLKNLNVLNILGLVKEMPSFYCFKFLSA